MGLKSLLKQAGLSTLARLSSPGTTPLNTIRNFVIFQHATALGSVIHSTPLVSALRAAVPEAHITVITSGFGPEVFANNPEVDELVAIPNPTRDLRGAIRTLRKWRAGKQHEPFATLTTVGNERLANALTLWSSNLNNRIGFTLAPQLYRNPMTFDPAMSQIANNLRLVTALGHTAVAAEPKVYVTPANLRRAKDLLPDHNPGRPLITIVSQTSPTQRKGWRAERWQAAAEHLITTHNADLVFVGTASERAAIEALRAPLPTGATWNVAGETSLPELAALLSLCAVGLTLDTGTLHLGRAVGLPMTVIAPAWSPPLEWLPLENPHYTILKNAEMPEATSDYIIDEVSVAEVNAAMDDLLLRYPASANR